MGNTLCCVAPGPEQLQSQDQEPAAGTSAATSHAHTHASPHSAAKPVAAAPTKAAAPANPIDVALAEARKELEKAHTHNFEEKYSAGKLIGHGAFAKVSICQHKENGEKFAVKVVAKNLEDPQKQRDGGLEACTRAAASGFCMGDPTCGWRQSACIQREGGGTSAPERARDRGQLLGQLCGIAPAS